MTDATPNATPNHRELGEQLLKSLDKGQMGAVAAKLVAAAIGDLVVLFSRSPAHKHYALADIEWMVLPPVVTRQAYVVEATNKETGVRAPVAAVTWALVSEELDLALQQQAGSSMPRLRPDQWKCGETGWLIDAVGNAEGIRMALQWLAAGPFKDRPLKMSGVRKAGGPVDVTTLSALLAERAGAGTTSAENLS